MIASLRFQRSLILSGLLLSAAGCWAVLIWQSREMESGMGLTMGMAAPLFMGIWVLMMVAMMFPTAAPMFLTFARVQAGRAAKGQAIVPTWIFVCAYLFLWSLFGLIAYEIASASEHLADDSQWLMSHAGHIGGLVILMAGLYQLTPLKRACLSRCRTPTTFVLTSWRDGIGGTIRMGLEHGVYCLGCCFLLFVILFPLGVMNVAAMALITALIFAEKSLAVGSRVAVLAALILVVYGGLVIIHPDFLPTMT